LVSTHIPEKAYPEQWDTEGLKNEVMEVLGLDLPIDEWAKEEGIADEEIRERLEDHSNRRMAEKVVRYGADVMRMVEKSLLLQILDQIWKDHLLQLDHLRQAVSLRAYAQKDPLNEYKSEAFSMFQAMLSELHVQVTTYLSHVELQQPTDGMQREAADESQMQATHIDPVTGENEMAAEFDENDPSTWGKVRRNDPCPCGSGKKFKHCHGLVS